MACRCVDSVPDWAMSRWSEAARKPAMFGKAVALQILRRFDEAEAAYERLLAQDSRAEEALTNLLAMGLEVFDPGVLRTRGGGFRPGRPLACGG